MQLKPQTSLISRLRKDFKSYRSLYLLAVPMLLFYLIFSYGPMYGQIIAFKDFTPGKGIWGSDWVGVKHFVDFFTSRTFSQLVRNTILINVYLIVFAFPVPIIFAILLNEIKTVKFKRSIQTVSYLPHFISLVVVCSIILTFTKRDGLVNDIIVLLGGKRVSFMSRPEWFRTIYTITDIWQEMGWGSIIYIAAMGNIDTELYEAATIDGAGRWKKIWHVTLPGISTMIAILLILRVGNLLTLGFEKIILLYNPLTYETADVISTYVYRMGLMEFNYSYASAVGLLNSVINLLLLTFANRFSRMITGSSLW